MIELAVTQLDPDLPVPAYAHPGDAGLDLRSTIDGVLEPQCRMLVPCGVAIALPEGYAGLVIPRSGLAARHGVSIVNAPGLIDAGYRGEIKVSLINLDPSESFAFKRGDRIAQLMVTLAPVVALQIVDQLPDSNRGAAGFGSSGLH